MSWSRILRTLGEILYRQRKKTGAVVYLFIVYEMGGSKLPQFNNPVQVSRPHGIGLETGRAATSSTISRRSQCVFTRGERLWSNELGPGLRRFCWMYSETASE